MKSEDTRSPKSGITGAHPCAYRVAVEPGGLSFEAPDSLTLLEAARSANIGLPSSCRNGTCRECMCQLVSGTVNYRIEWPGLTPEEKAENFILPCVAVAQSDIVIRAPRAKRLG
jgi:ferredoxin